MNKKFSIKINQKRQKMAFLICAIFLVAITMGAILANCLQAEQTARIGADLKSFFGTIKENGILQKESFWQVYLKYLKYDVLIWLGGWSTYGLFVSGAALCFRGISVGFTTAMLMAEYGGKGLFAAALSILPQNLVLIPAYLFMTWIAVCFLMERSEKLSGKRGLRREQQRRMIEYSILFAGSLLLLAGATLLEVGVTPALMKSAALFL